MILLESMGIKAHQLNINKLVNMRYFLLLSILAMACGEKKAMKVNSFETTLNNIYENHPNYIAHDSLDPCTFYIVFDEPCELKNEDQRLRIIINQKDIGTFIIRIGAIEIKEKSLVTIKSIKASYDNLLGIRIEHLPIMYEVQHDLKEVGKINSLIEEIMSLVDSEHLMVDHKFNLDRISIEFFDNDKYQILEYSGVFDERFISAIQSNFGLKLDH